MLVRIQSLLVRTIARPFLPLNYLSVATFPCNAFLLRSNHACKDVVMKTCGFVSKRGMCTVGLDRVVD